MTNEELNHLAELETELASLKVREEKLREALLGLSHNKQFDVPCWCDTQLRRLLREHPRRE